MAGETILVVDDNPVNLKLIRVMLTGEGYEVRTAADAEDALRILERFTPRLILMDIQFPGMDGLALTRQLKADPATRDASAKHLLQLINDVLDLAKVEAGQMEFHPQPVRLANPIREVRDALRALSAQKRITVDVQIDASVEDIVADPAKLKQVLYNYLSNALKFTPDGGRVVIRLAPEDGIGIKPEDIGRLFTEFRQLDASAAKSYPGTGLGRAFTKRIVEAQGGRVGVRSTFGKGSVFFAVLPRHSRVGLIA